MSMCSDDEGRRVPAAAHRGRPDPAVGAGAGQVHLHGGGPLQPVPLTGRLRDGQELCRPIRYVGTARLPVSVPETAPAFLWRRNRNLKAAPNPAPVPPQKEKDNGAKLLELGKP